MSESVLSTSEFVQQLRDILKEVPAFLEHESNYIQLTQVDFIAEDTLKNTDALPLNNPLVAAFNLIIDTSKNSNIDHIELGINELLKTYIEFITAENQSQLTKMYSYRLHLIFIWCVNSSFIYTSHIWRYLIECLVPVSHYLLDHELLDGCTILWKQLGLLGQGASQNGLSTYRMQKLLRSLEVKAEDIGWVEGARLCQQQRHDLELT